MIASERDGALLTSQHIAPPATSHKSYGSIVPAGRLGSLRGGGADGGTGNEVRTRKGGGAVQVFGRLLGVLGVLAMFTAAVCGVNQKWRPRGLKSMQVLPGIRSSGLSEVNGTLTVTACIYCCNTLI